MGKTPSGDVTAGHIHVNDALAQADTGNGFFLELVEAFPLGRGKSVNLLVGKPDILLDVFRDRGDEALFLLLAEDKFPIPTVEFFGEFGDGSLAVFFDLCKNIFDDAANSLCIGLGGFLRLFDVLQSRLPILLNIS